jgi:hypothetical protein
LTGLIESDLWEEQTLYAEGSPAKTYPSQVKGQDLQGTGPDCSGMHSLSLKLSKRDGSCWRMSPDYLRQIRDAISEQSLLHWPTQGMSTLNGDCLIRSSSESPNVDVESSLSQVLESQADDRYLLSPRAAAGILRRSERQGEDVAGTAEGVTTALAFYSTAGSHGVKLLHEQSHCGPKGRLRVLVFASLPAWGLIGFSHNQGIDIQPSTDNFPTLRAGGGGLSVMVRESEESADLNR